MEQLSQWPLLQLLPLCWAVGRLLLALLPAGEPGGGRIGETWLVQATSLGLGWLALESEGCFLSWIGVELSPWAQLTPWGLLLVLWWTSLPGRIVPRHAPERDPVGLAERWVSRLGLGLCLLAILLRARVDQSTGIPGQAAHVMLESAALISVVGTLSVLRTRGWVRALVLLVGGFEILVHEHPLDLNQAAVLCGTAIGLMGALAWARRGDRRSRVLCALIALLLCAQGIVGCCAALALAGSLCAGTAPVRIKQTLAEVTPALGAAGWILMRDVSPLGTTRIMPILYLVLVLLGLAAIRVARQKDRTWGRMGGHEASLLWTQPVILLTCAALLPLSPPLGLLLLVPGLLGLTAGLFAPLERSALVPPCPSVNGVRVK